MVPEVVQAYASTKAQRTKANRRYKEFSNNRNDFDLCILLV